MNKLTKSFINASTALFLMTALTACSTTNKSPTSSTLNSDFPYTFDQITGNVWVIHGPREIPNPENKGFMNNPGLIKTSAGLVVIDPGSTVQVGEYVLTEIKKISEQNIVAVFNTHVHGDHWLANQAIKAAYPNVKIYGHPKMIRAIENGEGENWVTSMEKLTKGASKGTIVVAPDNEVDNEDVIKIGNTQFKLHHHGVAHTHTDIMIEVVEESVVFLGDNVLAKRLGRMNDGKFLKSISTIATVLETNAKIYVPGHGPTGDSTMVKAYRDYLSLVYDAAKKAFDDDLDSSDVASITSETTAAYKDWADYDLMIGPHGAQAYSEVEAAEF